METLWRQGASYPDTPIILVTGTKDDLVESAAVKTGAQDYLVKGEFDGTTILRTIRHAIDRQSHRQRLATSTRDADAPQT